MPQHINKEIDENGIQWTQSRCFFCHMNCSLFVGVNTKTGLIEKIEANEEQGSMNCERIGANGENAIRFHYHPKRINHAMKRVGERGEDKWEEIPYDQALDEIAAKPCGTQGKIRPRNHGRFRRHLPFRPPVGAQPLLEPVRQPRQHHRSGYHLLVLDLYGQPVHVRLAAGVGNAGHP